MARKTERYAWNDGDFIISSEVDLPDDLKTVVANAPKESEDIGQYLKNLVDDGTITPDDIMFLLQSGTL